MWDLEILNDKQDSAKRSRVQRFMHDPLALSWACYHRTIRDNLTGYFPNLATVTPAAEDFAKAEESRAYYRDKIMFDKLRFNSISQFKHSLYQLLTTHVVTSENIGMLYKIPYFYTEDMDKQNLKQVFRPIVRDALPLHNPQKNLSLRPRARIRRFRKNMDIMEFWLADEQDYPHMLSVTRNNQLLKLFESLFEKQCLDIKAYVSLKPRHYNIDFEYFQLVQIELR